MGIGLLNGILDLLGVLWLHLFGLFDLVSLLLIPQNLNFLEQSLGVFQRLLARRVLGSNLLERLDVLQESLELLWSLQFGLVG